MSPDSWNADADEQQLRRALTAIAQEGGEPDERAAWERVRDRAARAPRQRARRAAIGLATVAAVGALVVAVLAVEGPDEREHVDLGPAGPPSSEVLGPPPDVATWSGVGPVEPGFPAHPVAVVVDDDGFQRLDLYDGDTGALVTRDLARTGHSISEVSIHRDGVIFFTEEFGDSNTVRAVAWDGSGEPVSPLDAGMETLSPAVSPDGRTFAYLRQGVTIMDAEVVIVDTASGDQRTLRWESDDPRAATALRNLEWSPDGARLLFTVSDTEGSEPMVVPASATSLSAADPVALAASHAHWEDADTIVGLTFCCAPDFDEPRELRHVELATGETSAVGVGELRHFDTDGTELAIVRLDGSVALVGGDGTTTTIAVERPALAVALPR